MSVILSAYATEKEMRAFYIGLNDKKEEGSFVWSDGKPLLYTHWIEGRQPNNRDEKDCFLFLTNKDGGWSLRRGTRAFYFICQMSLRVIKVLNLW